MLTAVSTHACIAESLIAGARSLMPFFRVQTSGELSSSPQYHHAIVSVLPISSSPRATEQAKQLFSGGEGTAARRDDDASAGRAPAGSSIPCGFLAGASGHRPPCKQPSSTALPAAASSRLHVAMNSGRARSWGWQRQALVSGGSCLSTARLRLSCVSSVSLAFG